MASSKFYVAKVNVNQNIFNSEEIVSNIINEKIPEQILNFGNKYKGKFIAEVDDRGNETRWSLANTSKSGKNIIVGNLTKSVPLQYDSINQENRIIEKSLEDEFKTESVFFIYFIDIEKLCFRTNLQINRTTFIKKFKQLLEFEEGIETIGEVEILLVTESHEVKNILLTKKVTEIHIEVIQPNGSRRRQYESMQKIIQENKSKKTEIKLKNNDGLQVKKENEEDINDLLSEGLEMTEQGYGSMSVSYMEGKKTKKSSTDNRPLTLNVPVASKEIEENDSVIINLEERLKEREKS